MQISLVLLSSARYSRTRCRHTGQSGFSLSHSCWKHTESVFATVPNCCSDAHRCTRDETGERCKKTTTSGEERPR
jgi:hypothetical protein